MCQSLFFNKVAGLGPFPPFPRCFPVNLAKFLRTPLLTEHLRWLLLLISNIEKFYHFKSLISENQKKKNVITHKISHKTVKMQISNMKPNKTKSPLLYIMLNQADIISYEAYFIKGNNKIPCYKITRNELSKINLLPFHILL